MPMAIVLDGLKLSTYAMGTAIRRDEPGFALLTFNLDFIYSLDF
jgi:hypothetical protein